MPLGSIAPHKRLTSRFQIAPNRLTAGDAHRHHALLRSLSPATHDLRVGDEVPQFQRAQLADAESATIEHLENRPIAQIARRSANHGCHQSPGRLLVQNARQNQVLLRGLKSLGDIDLGEAFKLQVMQKLTKRNERARPRGGPLPLSPQRLQIVDDVLPRDSGME